MQNSGSYLAFGLEPHRFAVRADCAREVVRAVAVVPSPEAPQSVEGVIRYRGREVAVLDLRSHLGMPIRRLHPDPHFIVAEAGTRLVALRVDRPPDLLTIEAPPADPDGSATRVSSGFTRLPDGLVVIDDLERFLSLDPRVPEDPSFLGPPVESPPVDETTLVAFMLGGEAWCLEAALVWEAFRLQYLVPLPGAPAPIAGASPWRGSVLSVIDLRKLLGIGLVPLPELQHVLVIGDEHPRFGVLVDALGEVMTFARARLSAVVTRDWSLGTTPSGALALDGKRLIRQFTP